MSKCKNCWWDTVVLFDNYFGTIMQGCVHLAKDIMLMQAFHKLEFIAAMLQGCYNKFPYGSVLCCYRFILIKNTQKYIIEALVQVYIIKYGNT